MRPPARGAGLPLGLASFLTVLNGWGVLFVQAENMDREPVEGYEPPFFPEHRALVAAIGFALLTLLAWAWFVRLYRERRPAERELRPCWIVGVVLALALGGPVTYGVIDVLKEFG